VLTGLTPGAAYIVSFDEATTTVNGFYSANFSGGWNVSFGGTTQTSTPMPTTAYSGTNWVSDSLVFIATSTTQTLSFVATDTSGAPPFVLLDGVSVTSPIPEPATLGLAAIGVAGLLAVRRQRRSRAG
jgi:hypothetical protein